MKKMLLEDEGLLVHRTFIVIFSLNKAAMRNSNLDFSHNRATSVFAKATVWKLRIRDTFRSLTLTMMTTIDDDFDRPSKLKEETMAS